MPQKSELTYWGTIHCQSKLNSFCIINEQLPIFGKCYLVVYQLHEALAFFWRDAGLIIH